MIFSKINTGDHVLLSATAAIATGLDGAGRRLIEGLSVYIDDVAFPVQHRIPYRIIFYLNL
jgi:hypothetical protein